MSNLTAQIQTTISASEEAKLAKYIQETIIKQIHARLTSKKVYLHQVISNYADIAFKTYPQVHELIFGRLRYDLGITEGEAQSVVSQIPEIISRTMSINFIPVSDGVDVMIGLVPSDYSDILSIKEAVFQHSKNTSQNPGQPIYWLRWLLLGGPGIIIDHYKVMYIQKNTQRSRSGGALMIQRGSGWRVPPPFDGVADDNIITRSLHNMKQIIEQEIIQIVTG